MARIHRDSIKTVLLAVGIIVVLAIGVFFVASLFLKPKPTEDNADQPTYQAKAQYPNTPITLSYWRTVDGVSVFDPILAEWKALHPNVTINITEIPFAQYDQRLAAAAASNTLPDLFMLRADWLPRYQKSMAPSPGSIFSVTDYKRTFAPITAQDLIKDDKVYAVSYGIPTLGLFYNTDLFAAAGVQEPPKTWQELVDANSKLSQKQGQLLFKSGVALGTANVNAASSILPLLMLQNGASMTDLPPTKATFDQPSADGYQAGAKALSFYLSFAQPNKSTYGWSDALGDSTQAFATGKTAMIVQYPFRYLDIKASSPSLNFKMAKVPQVNASSNLNYAEYWAEGVAASSQNIDIAWDFYNFMTTRHVMNQYSVPTMKPASRLDLAKAQEQDSLLGPFAAQVPTATSYYKGNNAASDAAIVEMINIALSGFDPLIALRGANTKVTSSIRQFPY